LVKYDEARENACQFGGDDRETHALLGFNVPLAPLAKGGSNPPPPILTSGI